MTAIAALYWLLTALAGGLVAGVVRLPLRIEERLALAVVTGVLGSAVCTLGLATIAGMRSVTVLAGPALLALIGLLGSAITGRVLDAWRQSLAEVGARVRSGELLWIGGIALVAIAGFAVLFRHTLFTQDGAIVSNFATVWADWSMHATTASSFAVGQNLPPTNPIYSGTTLLYPFLPDFQSGMLVTLGSGVGAALAIPGALMCVAITVLVVSLARRLTGSIMVGVLAMAMCLVGGGLGIEGLYWDACTAHSTTAAQCDPGRFVHDPIGAVSTAAHTVHNVPGAVAAQARPYDGLPGAGKDPPLNNLQWYTPLTAWWLPQRPFLFGFAAVLCVLLLVMAAREQPGRRWSAFVIAGLLAGVLPLVHVHSFIALVLVLPVLAMIWRGREWVALAALAIVFATPRLVQLAIGDHGSIAQGNAFPWLEPGWLSQSVAGAAQEHREIALSSLGWAVQGGLRSLVTPEWWGFWVVNCGIVLPVMVVLGLAALGRLAPEGSGARTVASRIAGVVPADLLRFCLPFLVIFALCNIVVFQSWDWDNTKLFAYWYFGAALLLSGVIVSWWRSGWWRATLGTLALVSVIMTGTVVMLRYMPWTPPANSNAGPFAWATPEGRSLASQVETQTPPDAVFLTLGRHTDTLQTLAGRHTVVGYLGWLWSYGIDYRGRAADVAVMYEGCVLSQTHCDATALMHAYGVSYVELPMFDYVQAYPRGNPQWWSSTFPVVARAGDTVVYDVRSAQ